MKWQTRAGGKQLAGISVPAKLRPRRMNTSSLHHLDKYWPSSCELMDNCKGTNYIITDSGLARAGTATELSLWSKLGGSLHRSLVEILPSIDTLRAKAIITFELSLFNKFDRVTAPKFGREATIGGDPEACQWTKGNLHDKISSDRPSSSSWDIDSMMTSYQPGFRNMAGSVAYFLIQQSTRSNTCRTVVDLVTRQLAC